MHEWSPKAYHSGSVTTNQLVQTKTYTQCCEENSDRGRPNANLKPMNTYRVGDKPSGFNTPIVKEDEGIFQTYRAKKKKNTSDPRFKRIINPEVKKETDTDGPKKKFPVLPGDQNHSDVKDKVISLLKPPKDISLYAKPSTKKFGDAADNSSPDLMELVTKDPGLEISEVQNDSDNAVSKRQYNFKKSCKLKKNTKTGLKKSASDCTLHMKNIYGDENEEDLQRIRLYPSGTQVASTNNRRKHHKVDKRRSVITVIGQTQTKSFNELMKEINQRRKLAKELDKHALCEAITETKESQSEVKNLVAKVDFVLPDGKVIYSAEKIYMCKDKHKDCEECVIKSRENLDDQYKKRRDMIPERDSSASRGDRRSRPKRSSKKLVAAAKESSPLKGKVTYFTPKLFFVFLLLALFFVFVCICMDSIKPLKTYYSFQKLFTTQTLPWYEKFFI